MTFTKKDDTPCYHPGCRHHVTHPCEECGRVWGAERAEMTKEELIHWIDSASYEELLRKWRFAPAGDPFFRNEVGVYYCSVLHRKREEIGPEKHAAVSKRVGWSEA